MSLSEEQQIKLQEINKKYAAERFGNLSSEGKAGFIISVMSEGFTREQALSVANLYSTGEASELEKAVEILRKQEKSDSNPRG